MPPTTAGATIVVAVFTTDDFKGPDAIRSCITLVPIAPAVSKERAIAPGKFPLVTTIGAATPVLAAAEYNLTSREVM